MPEDIDSLQIKISSNAGSANKSLNNLIDTLGRLSGALSFKTDGLKNLSGGISELSDSMRKFKNSEVTQADFTRIAKGLSTISAVKSQGVVNAATSINELARNLNGLSSITFDSQGIANLANSISKLGRGTVTQAASNIPKLKSALSALSSGLGDLNFGKLDIDGFTTFSSLISKLGSKSAVGAASGNIEKLGIALKNMLSTLSAAPKVSENVIRITQALANLASTGGRTGTAMRGLSGSLNLFSSSTGKAKKSAGGLAAAFGKFYATYWLILRSLGTFKKAIDISSDLTEVQNVVDVTFGDMAETMNNFAASSLQTYGMSELTAKRIASRFQAMGVSMGFAQGKMSEMSIELTKLAGDMASFYNESQESVAKALQSIFTGETEPLMLAA